MTTLEQAVPRARTEYSSATDGHSRLSGLPQLSGDAAMHGIIARELFCTLTSHLERLPLGVREATESVILYPQRFFDAEDLAKRASLSRRHLDRIFVSTGFAPVKHLIIGCRAHAAVRLLTMGVPTVDIVATIVGYDSARAVARHTDMIWGCTPREASALPPVERMDVLKGFMTRD